MTGMFQSIRHRSGTKPPSSRSRASRPFSASLVSHPRRVTMRRRIERIARESSMIRACMEGLLSDSAGNEDSGVDIDVHRQLGASDRDAGDTFDDGLVLHRDAETLTDAFDQHALAGEDLLGPG